MASISRQRRVAAAILFPTLGLCGVLIAQGATQLAAVAALPLDASAGVPPLTNVAAEPRERADAMPILRRNIFDHETGRLDVIDEPETDPEIEEPAPVMATYDPNGPPPPPCEGASMRLVGAFVLVRRPEDSFAAITDATGQSLLYQEGMTIDERQLVAIQREMVVLRPRSGSLCSLSMFAPPPQPGGQPQQPQIIAAAEPAERPPGNTQEGLDPSTLEAGITQVNEREFTIERSLVQGLLANQAALMRTARVIPHEEGGRVVGVKLYGIRRSSLLGRLGIQNGDMLRTINGFDMTSPDSALEAYARLQNADRITINLNRRGQDMAVDYSIR
jgi:general secretion pathway protein C